MMFELITHYKITAFRCSTASLPASTPLLIQHLPMALLGAN